MLDGTMLRGLTGTPMGRRAWANSSLADAEPEPLTVANLTTKSCVDAIGTWVGVMRGLAGLTSQGRSPLQRYSCRLPRPLAATPRSRMRRQQLELLHVPGTGRAAFGAQAAVQADVLVLDHHAQRLQRLGHVEFLREVQRRRGQPRAQVGLVAVGGEGDAVGR